jgi:RsiW-degrading membrane proteinase PrsW (M82 family)
VLLYVAVCLSAFLAAILVYRYDLYNREPWHLLALSAGLGFIAMRLVAPLELRALGWVSGGAPAEAAVAAILEEGARVLAVVLIAVTLPRQFDDPMDGIIYGSIVGLGMSVEESLYVLRTPMGVERLLYPFEVVRLLGHLVMGGIAGFGVGLLRVASIRAPGPHPIQCRPRSSLGRLSSARQARCGRRQRFSLRDSLRSPSARAAGAFSAAVLLHFSWDWIALLSDGRSLSPKLTVLASAVMLAGLATYGSLVVLGSTLSRARFAPSSPKRLWGFPFRSR